MAILNHVDLTHRKSEPFRMFKLNFVHLCASICHFSDFWSICCAGIIRHFPLEFTGWTILVPTLDTGYDMKILTDGLLVHLSRRLKGELIVYQSSRRLCVCVSVNIFKLEYFHSQWANRNKILSEPSLGWGKGCIRFWARSDRNSGVHGNG